MFGRLPLEFPMQRYEQFQGFGESCDASVLIVVAYSYFPTITNGAQ